MKLNFDFSSWISPVSGNIAFWQSFPDLPVNYTIEGDRENRAQPSSALIDIRLDIIDLRYAIDNLEQRPYPGLNATYILQQPSANLPNAQALNQLINGIMKNNVGVVQIATPNVDYLTPTLPSGKLWIGNSSNIATPSQIITIDNLPTLGTASITIPNPFDPTNPITISGGKIWHGTDSNRPEESTALLTVEGDIALINARFLTGEFIMGDALVQATWPKAQFLKNLQDGILKKTGKTLQRAVPGTDYILNLTTNNVFVGDANNLPVAQATILQQNLPTLTNNNLWIGDVNNRPVANPTIALNNLPNLTANNLWIGGADNRPAAQSTISLQNLPNLSNGRVWQGDAANRPIEVQLNLAPTDATYIIKTPNATLTNAQVLSELGTGMAKIVAGGAFAIAISGQDYATAQQLEEIKTQCQQSAEQAATSAQEASASATEASASAGEATTAAGEATAAAGEASASAGAAGVSAGAAAVSALAAAGSAASASSSSSSASSSASDASDSASSASHSASNASGSATNAANSATQAQTYLNTLLNTGLTLQGDVTGSGLLNAPIVTTFKPNPVFTGNQSMTIPSGNVSQRPASLMVGMLRLNMGN